jgi:uncharacterized protein YeeX (DUF496 family)
MLVKENKEINTQFNYNDASEEDKNNYLNFKVELDYMNRFILLTGRNEKWVMDAHESNNECIEGNGNDGTFSGTTTNPTIFYPQKCRPLNRDWIIDLGTSDNIYKEAKILTDTLKLVDYAKNKDLANNGYLAIINDLKSKYEKYLDQYINTLDEFGRIINQITGKLNQYINKDEGVFSFVRCKFIGTNLKVMLKYLKSALGGDMKTVGICLSIVGCSLALSISSTILLIVIINLSIDENKKKQKEENSRIPEYPTNSEGRVIRYK